MNVLGVIGHKVEVSTLPMAHELTELCYVDDPVTICDPPTDVAVECQ